MRIRAGPSPTRRGGSPLSRGERAALQFVFVLGAEACSRPRLLRKRPAKPLTRLSADGDRLSPRRAGCPSAKSNREPRWKGRQSAGLAVFREPSRLAIREGFFCPNLALTNSLYQVTLGL
jgi:hypothetical protein